MSMRLMRVTFGVLDRFDRRRQMIVQAGRRRAGPRRRSAARRLLVGQHAIDAGRQPQQHDDRRPRRATSRARRRCRRRARRAGSGPGRAAAALRDWAAVRHGPPPPAATAPRARRRHCRPRGRHRRPLDYSTACLSDPFDCRGRREAACTTMHPMALPDYVSRDPSRSKRAGIPLLPVGRVSTATVVQAWRNVTEQQVLAALTTVRDPERGRDIVSLGMISGLVMRDGNVGVLDRGRARARRPHWSRCARRPSRRSRRCPACCRSPRC